MGKDGSGMRLEVDESLVVPVVEEQIRMAVVREMEKMDDLLPKMVQYVLESKVNYKGVKDQYNSNNKYDLIDVTFKNAITEASREAIKEYVENNKELFTKEFEKQLKNSSSELAQAFITGITNAVENKYRFKVEMSLSD